MCHMKFATDDSSSAVSRRVTSTCLVHVPWFAVGGDAITGLGDQPGEGTQKNTAGGASDRAMGIRDGNSTGRAGHVHRERRDFLDTRTIAQVSRNRHTRE